MVIGNAEAGGSPWSTLRRRRSAQTGHWPIADLGRFRIGSLSTTIKTGCWIKRICTLKLSRQIGITTSARPLRVAYCVPLTDPSNDILTKIFDECYSRWGGRYTLIVPCINNGIDPAYLTWLRCFDPDIIYTYLPLPQDMHENMDKIMPQAIITHRHLDDGRPNYWPHLNLMGLSSFSGLPALKMTVGNLTPRITSVIDAYPFWEGDGFVTDSFGVRSSSAGRTMVWPIDLQIRDFVGSLAILPPNAPSSLNHMQKADREVSENPNFCVL